MNNGGTNYYNSDKVLPRQMFYRETDRVWFDLIPYPYKFGDYLEDEDGTAREDDHQVRYVTWGQFQDVYDNDNPESNSKPGDNKTIHIAKKTYDKIKLNVSLPANSPARTSNPFS